MRSPPRYDIVVLIPRFSARAADLCRRGLFDTFLDSTRLLGADAHYRRRSDVALLILHVDMRLVTGTVLVSLRRVCEQIGATFFEIAKMSAADRRRYEAAYLRRQDEGVRDVPSAQDALILLAEALGIRDAAPAPASSAPPAQVRFRRGDTWIIGRLCRISEEGAFIATGGPPRLGDRAQVEVTTPRGSASIESVTVQLTPPHAAAALGVAGFGARFHFASQAEARAASPVLASARAAIARSAPPPRRRHTRFPVNWSASLDATSAALHVVDVSQRGLLLASPVPLRGRIEVDLPLDERGARVRLAGRVARAVAPTSGSRHYGVGVELVDVGDTRRFGDFVERVARRARRRVVIGAGAERLRMLSRELSGAGYLVAGASDPTLIYDRIIETKSPPDLVIIDETITDGNVSAALSLDRALRRRDVETFRVEKQGALATRYLVDAALVS